MQLALSQADGGGQCGWKEEGESFMSRLLGHLSG